jgi:cyclophilin family peptidyl-prolyl cis-trans isomerase
MSRPTALRIVSSLLLLSLGILGVRASASAQPAPKPPVVTHTAIMRTSLGTIELELYGLDAPKTVKNFVELSKKQFYNGILFHRVVPGFVIQAGDPYSRDSAANRGIWGQGGQSIYGSTFADELVPSLKSVGYMEGVIAMANRGPNTNTSQFFIVLNDAVSSRLPYNYTIFGRVTKGLDIVHKIERAELDPRYNGQPKQPITIVQIDAVEVKPANH